MKLRVYNPKGQERWVPAGTRIPAGWFGPDLQPLEVDHAVVVVTEDGNPYDQHSRPQRTLALAVYKP